MKTPDARPLYVSLHVPKTGGSTFRQILEQKFGDRFQSGYSRAEARPIVDSLECVHGHEVKEHFGQRIARSKATKWITFLREPLASAVSAYHFAKRNPRSKFVDRGIEEYLTHAHPYKYPNPPGYHHNRFSGWLESPSIEEYDFVGLTERFDESLLLLFRKFDWEPVYYRSENVGHYDPPALAPEIVSRFKELNVKDYQLYNTATALFEDLLKQYGPGFDTDLAAYRRSNGCSS